MSQIDWNSLGFKYLDTNAHVRYTWRDGVWDSGELVKEPYINLHIAATCLHYGQAAFEGLKVFACKDGKARAFRPFENARRLRRTAMRSCMAEPPEELFIDAVRRVVEANRDFIPPYGTGGSLYVRPLLLGSGAQIGIAPSSEYTFLVLVTPVGAYYKGGLEPVRALIVDDYDRAAPRGMGNVKIAGNYAASLYAHEKAKQKGFPVELYLDARTHTYIDEFATSNFFAITANNEYVTPDSETVLPSVTNDTLQQVAEDIGLTVQRRPVTLSELSSFSEIGACGTAVVVTPISEIVRGDTVIRVGGGANDFPVLQKLYNRVQGIQHGDIEDDHEWCLDLDVTLPNHD